MLSYLRTPQEGLTEFVENYMELQAMNSMCKLQKYDYKKFFYLFISERFFFFFYRDVSAQDVMKKVMYAFMNWDMGKFIRCLRIMWDIPFM